MLFESSNLISSSAIILFNTLLTNTVIFHTHVHTSRVWSMLMRTHHMCGQCVCTHTPHVWSSVCAHTPHVWSMCMHTHTTCVDSAYAHEPHVHIYAHTPSVWSMRMRTHHVVTINSRKLIIVITIGLLLSRYITLSILSLSPSMYTCTCMSEYVCIICIVL